jgi:hypothetical protein
MTALGISVSYQAAQPVVTGVVLAGARDALKIEHSFEIKTDTDDVPDQIDGLVRAVRSKINGLAIKSCVVRIADFARNPSNKPAPRHRLMIEGALVFAARDSGIGSVRILNGKDVGLALGTSKDDALGEAATIDAKRKEAVSAAIAGLIA